MFSPYIIEIVPADRGWILETMARAIEREGSLLPGRFNVKIVDKPSGDAELTFFLPESAYRPLNKSITVTYLAHKEAHAGAAALFEQVARSSDCCITSSTKYQKVLQADGAKKVFKVHLGVDTELFTPKLRLGVVGRTYHTGRKGEALLSELAGMSMVDLNFTGDGWPYPADHYETNDLPEFFQRIDYLLIPSLVEGGPVPMLEALSCGCPVIAPSDIGLVEDFPHVPFKRGDAKDLRRVVEGLLEQKLALRNSVLDCDWGKFARRHLKIFSDLIDERRLIQPATATSIETEGLVRVLLLTHGTEDAAKGGPSTRVRFIVSKLREAGHTVEALHNVPPPEVLERFDIVHVFNSWPPQTAVECLSLARKAGKTVIFSPIALDLADWPVYRQLMERAFTTGSRVSVEVLVEQLPTLAPKRCYSGASLGVVGNLVEGIPGHFEALRQCCSLAHRLILLSERERDFLSALGARVEHGVIINNGVLDLYGGSIDASLFRTSFGFDSYVLCVGRVEYRKNQAMLALAMRDLSIPLVLIGDVGDPGYLDHVRMLGGANLYHFGRIEDKALLASAYAGASVFVLPSWCEGAPLAALEAGFTGVPLVLSDRSSEPEYFGDFARYISPADPISMRERILEAIEQSEPPESRSSRVAFLKARYSEVEHVRATLELYRESATSSSISEGELVIDVSSLLHSIRTGGHLTGVPLAEHNLVAEILKTNPEARCIVFNDVKERFIEVAYHELVNFQPSEFNRRHWFSDDDITGGMDCRRELRLADVTLPPDMTFYRRPERWGCWSNRVAGLLRRLGFSQRMLAAIRHSLGWLRALVVLPSPASDTNRSVDQVDFSKAERYLVTTRVPRTRVTLKPGSRILSLGQGWLSNEPLLDKLVELSAGHRLEVYVYDISYVSGAHYSGWGDNDDRQRRLVRLLTHATTVFTESKITAGELAKFASSRSLAFRIVRTKLRGKKIPPRLPPAGFGRAEPFVLYVSSFNRRKNHDFIISVWRDIMATSNPISQLGVKLRLVGEIQGESKFGCQDTRRELERCNIEIIDNVDDSTLHSYYFDCLFTIYPSLQEGWGIPVQESLMSGKVCLASATVPAAIEIENAALIRLAPNNFFAWREAIVTWVANPTMRSAFEAEAARYVPPSWEDIAEAVVSARSMD